MDVLDNLKQAVDLLKEIDDYGKELNGEDGLLSVCDKKISYWLHYLEFEDLKLTEVYNICREIKNQRMLRRKYKRDCELIKVYKDNNAKLQNASNRDMLVTLICKTTNKQEKATFDYTAYTDEERDAILKRKKGVLVGALGLVKGEKDDK